MNTMKIDIVSDVVCPWCIVGYKQLEQALEQTQTTAEIHWQPFELNPAMAPEGQNLQEHIAEKYGSTKAQSDENRDRLTTLGASLGFEFNFSDNSRIVNTFKSHQLLHWAGLQSHQQEHALKLALLRAFFTDKQDVSDEDVLVATTLSVGLDVDEALRVLQQATYASDVRERERLWLERGITGVPAMIFDGQYLVSGAQGVDNYVAVIHQVLDQSKGEV